MLFHYDWELYSTGEAFLLPTKQPRDQILAPLRFYHSTAWFVDNIEMKPI